MRNDLFAKIEPLTDIETILSRTELPTFSTFKGSVPETKTLVYMHSKSDEKWFVSGQGWNSCALSNYTEQDIIDLKLRPYGKFHVDEGITLVIKTRIRYDILLSNMSKGLSETATKLTRDNYEMQKRIFNDYAKGVFPVDDPRHYAAYSAEFTMCYFIPAELIRKHDFIYSESLNLVISNDPNDKILRSFNSDTAPIREYFEGPTIKDKNTIVYINNNPNDILYQKQGAYAVPVKPVQRKNVEPGVYIDIERFDPEEAETERYQHFIPLNDLADLKKHGLYRDPYAAITDDKYEDRFEYDKAVIKKDTEQKKLEAAELTIKEKEVVLLDKQTTARAGNDSKNLASVATICTVAATVIGIVAKVVMSIFEKKAVSTFLAFLPFL